MTVFVVTMDYQNEGKYEDYNGGRDIFEGVYSTLDKAVEGIKNRVLTGDNSFDPDKLNPKFDTIDFTPVLEKSIENKKCYSSASLYYDDGWDLGNYSVDYYITEIEMD